jgi:NAD(P)-dependent dehydrogenase (short-subunit alcohol dehydrogenase family)
MPRRLHNQVAIVTGAGRGFGRTIALGLAAEGAAVALLARTATELERVAAEIRAGGGRALPLPTDVTLRADVARAVDHATAQLGAPTLLVSNAGVPGPFGPIWQVDPDSWWDAQRLHILAPLLLLQAVLPGMTARGAGRVIIVSAIASRMTAAYLSAYCVGKIAQTRITEEAALETRAHGVSIFAIDPGFVFTGLAEQTMNSPDAQRWLPGMVGRLRQKQQAADRDADLPRCAERCVQLASGRYDALSGRYFELGDDLEAELRKISASR